MISEDVTGWKYGFETGLKMGVLNMGQGEDFERLWNKHIKDQKNCIKCPLSRQGKKKAIGRGRGEVRDRTNSQ